MPVEGTRATDVAVLRRFHFRRFHQFSFSRRALLRGLGLSAGIAPFLPLLNASGQEPKRPKRLLLIYTPDGSSDGVDWKPQGTETSFTMHAMHAPLEPFKSKLVIPWGLKMSASGAGEQHAFGMAGLWDLYLAGFNCLSVASTEGKHFGPGGTLARLLNQISNWR
jgi:hypothetical protein